MSSYNDLQKHYSNNQHTWLITGIAGFIGSNLMESLLKLNQKVIGLDNFSTGSQKDIDEVVASLTLLQKDNFSFHEGDIRNIHDCEKVVQGVDFVLHQAALGSFPVR